MISTPHGFINQPTPPKDDKKQSQGVPPGVTPTDASLTSMPPMEQEVTSPYEGFQPGGTTGPQGDTTPTVYTRDASGHRVAWQATTWDAQGNPYFGGDDTPGLIDDVTNALKNWWGNTLYKFQKPLTTGEKITPFSVEEGANAGQVALEAVSKVGEGLDVIKNNMYSVPGGLGVVLRATDFALDSVLQLVQVPAVVLERGVGTLVYKAFHKDVTLDESWAASRIAYSGALKRGLQAELIRRYRGGEDPFKLAWELQNPIVEAVGQVIDPLVVVSWISKAGTAAKALSMTNKFLAEGKLVDTLAVLGKISDAGADAVKLADIAKDANNVLKAVDIVDDVADASKVASTIVDASNVADKMLTKGIAQIDEITKKVTGVIVDDARSKGWRTVFKPTQEARASAFAAESHITLSSLAANAQTPEEAQKLFENLAILYGSTDTAARKRALMILSDAGAGLVAGSEAGARTGKIMSDLIINGEKLNSGKLSKIVVNALKQDSPIAYMIEQLRPLVEASTKKMFPTAVEQLGEYQTAKKLLESGKSLPENLKYLLDKKGKLLAPSSVAVRAAATHADLQKVVSPINKVFAAVYMGMNPAYALRNMNNNLLTTLIDLPQAVPDALRGIFRKGEWMDPFFKKWGPNPQMLNKWGAGGPAGTVEQLSATSWLKKAVTTGTRLSAHIENSFASAISKKAMQMTLDAMVKPMLKDMNKVLIAAGIKGEQLEHVSEWFKETGGNVDEVMTRLRGGRKGSLLSVASPTELKTLQEYGLKDRLAEILETCRANGDTTPDNFNRMVDEMLQELKTYSMTADREETVVDVANLHDVNAANGSGGMARELVEEQKRVEAGSENALSKDQINIINKQVQAEDIAFNSAKDVLIDTTLAPDHPQLEQIRKVRNKITGEMDAIVEKRANDLENLRIAADEASKEEKSAAIRDRIWVNYRRTRAQYNRDARTAYVKAVQRGIEEIMQLDSRGDVVNPNALQKFREDVQLMMNWDNVDELRFIQSNGTEMFTTTGENIYSALPRYTNLIQQKSSVVNDALERWTEADNQRKLAKVHYDQLKAEGADKETLAIVKKEWKEFIEQKKQIHAELVEAQRELAVIKGHPDNAIATADKSGRMKYAAARIEKDKDTKLVLDIPMSESTGKPKSWDEMTLAEQEKYVEQTDPEYVDKVSKLRAEMERVEAGIAEYQSLPSSYQGSMDAVQQDYEKNVANLEKLLAEQRENLQAVQKPDLGSFDAQLKELKPNLDSAAAEVASAEKEVRRLEGVAGKAEKMAAEGGPSDVVNKYLDQQKAAMKEVDAAKDKLSAAKTKFDDLDVQRKDIEFERHSVESKFNPNDQIRAEKRITELEAAMSSAKKGHAEDVKRVQNFEALTKQYMTDSETRDRIGLELEKLAKAQVEKMKVEVNAIARPPLTKYGEEARKGALQKINSAKDTAKKAKKQAKDIKEVIVTNEQSLVQLNVKIKNMENEIKRKIKTYGAAWEDTEDARLELDQLDETIAVRDSVQKEINNLATTAVKNEEQAAKLEQEVQENIEQIDALEIVEAKPDTTLPEPEVAKEWESTLQKQVKAEREMWLGFATDDELVAEINSIGDQQQKLSVERGYFRKNSVGWKDKDRAILRLQMQADEIRAEQNARRMLKAPEVAQAPEVVAQVPEVAAQTPEAPLTQVAGAGGQQPPSIPPTTPATTAAPEPQPIPNVPSNHLPPTRPRIIADTIDDIETALNKVKTNAAAKWESFKDTPQDFTPDQEAALAAYERGLKNRAAEVKAKMMEAGDNARKSILLDYRDKKNFDLAYAYIMPYGYWYRGTYQNWFKRFKNNPFLLANYARYRTGLEKAHSNMPDWYKYQISSNDLPGVDSENPLYFNLEATLNPLNGLLGVDFSDPARRTSWFTALVDDMGKFGPSVWTPVAWSIGLVNAVGGNTDAAEAWIGRSVPITAGIRGATALMGMKGESGKGFQSAVFTPSGLELDPAMWLQGGMGRYDRRRIGRTLGSMIQRGMITEAQAMDANMKQSGEVWDQAIQMMMTENGETGSVMGSRGMSMTLGATLGTGFKQRTESDVIIDQFYTELFQLKNQRSNISPSEYSYLWTQLREKYPFMDVMLLSRKAGYDKEEAYAYSVINRIPPAQTDDFAKVVGLDSRLVERFIETKGDFRGWALTDKDRFMAGIMDLGAVLAVPPSTVRHDWAAAKQRYGSMMDAGKQQFGADIEEKVSNYYAAKNATDEDANNYLAMYPEVSQFLDWKQNTILSDETLRKYYGGIDVYEKFLNGKMYGTAAAKFGQDIFTKLSVYWEVKNSGGNVAQLLRDYPEISKYFDYTRAEKAKNADIIAKSGSYFPEKPQASIRPDANTEAIGAIDVMNAMREIVPTSTVEAMSAKYMINGGGNSSYSSSGGDLNIAKYVDEQAEKRWPGITTRIAEFEKLAAMNNGAAEEMYKKDATLQMYYTFDKAVRKQLSEAKKGSFAGEDAIPYVGELQYGTFFAGQELSKFVSGGGEISPELMNLLKYGTPMQYSP